MADAPRMLGVFREHFPGIWICTVCEKAGATFRIHSDPAGVHMNAGKKMHHLELDITRHMGEVHPGVAQPLQK